MGDVAFNLNQLLAEIGSLYMVQKVRNAELTEAAKTIVDLRTRIAELEAEVTARTEPTA